jgi:2-polyprenyl-3-methyl-5-hydroxy-6-metoxy-1,4-benzoquinol methylase
MSDYSMEKQSQFWNSWVSRSFDRQDPNNVRRGLYVLREVSAHSTPGCNILDVGCGNGWMSRRLTAFGQVTATDLSAEVIHLLRTKHPDIKWIDGDFVTLSLPRNHFDIVTCLETIAHVPDQEAFVRAIAQVTRPGGLLLLTTQNEYVWSRTSWLQPPGEGQIRKWPSRERLGSLFEPWFTIEALLTCAPQGDRGLPRLVNNRLSTALGRNVLGDERWTRWRERMGFGCSLFVKARRHTRTETC